MVVLAEWRAIWTNEQERIASWPESIVAKGRPDHRNLRVYNQLRKVESSILF
jgi:hypothetical protein